MFGLIDRHAQTVSLTDLGAAIVDPEQRGVAAVDAFLRVPLYRQVFDLYSGKLLPGDAGIEKELENLGVTQKSAAKARQVLQRSASHAGFFHSGRDRLVKPAGTSVPYQVDAAVGEQNPAAAEAVPATPLSAVETTGPTDPLLRGLWSKLPSDGALSTKEQDQWLEMAKLALRMVYDSEETEAPMATSAAPRPITETEQAGAVTVFAEPESA